MLTLRHKVVYTRHADEADTLCDEMLRAAPPLMRLGFDIEWKVSYVEGAVPRKAATVQLASSRGVSVFQLSAMGRFPARLAQILASRDVWKLGIGIRNDAIKLQRDYGVRCDGLLDLKEVAVRVLPDGIRPWALADLCERTLERGLRKGAGSARCGDWEATPLDDEALEYAALDAWAALAVWEALRAKTPRPPVTVLKAQAARARSTEEIAAALIMDVAASRALGASLGF
jgi:ribonuclease D